MWDQAKGSAQADCAAAAPTNLCCCMSRWTLLLLVGSTTGLPRWSRDTVQIYVHCCNQSGPWSDAALDKFEALGPGLRFGSNIPL